MVLKKSYLEISQGIFYWSPNTSQLLEWHSCHDNISYELNAFKCVIFSNSITSFFNIELYNIYQCSLIVSLDVLYLFICIKINAPSFIHVLFKVFFRLYNISKRIWLLSSSYPLNVYHSVCHLFRVNTLFLILIIFIFCRERHIM